LLRGGHNKYSGQTLANKLPGEIFGSEVGEELITLNFEVSHASENTLQEISGFFGLGSSQGDRVGSLTGKRSPGCSEYPDGIEDPGKIDKVLGIHRWWAMPTTKFQ
jgi:hypothetical protein